MLNGSQYFQFFPDEAADSPALSKLPLKPFQSAKALDALRIILREVQKFLDESAEHLPSEK
jgi:hypothetical protein